MLDLGDVVTQTLRLPADAGAVACTVTLPDGTTSSPAVASAGAGVYTAQISTAQAGRYVTRWVATGANAAVQTDVFWVAPADPGMIISLAYARAGLRLTSGQTSDDEDLRDLIVAATGPMEDVCGAIIPRTCDEWHDGGSTMVALDESPVISITSVTEGTAVLAAAPVDSSTASGWTLDESLGILTRRTGGAASSWSAGRGNIHVVYTAGRRLIPGNIIRATRRLVVHLWQTEINGVQPSGPGTITRAGYAVPNAVIEMCGREARIRPVAG